jgi:hypothetical protein
MAIIFRLQTGYELAGSNAELMTQADAIRKMVRKVWTKTEHRANGVLVTPKCYWRPVMYAHAAEKVTGIKLAGIMRRPVLTEDTWTKVLLNLTLARSVAESAKEFARNFRVECGPSFRSMPKNMALEVLQMLHKRDAEEAPHGDAARQISTSTSKTDAEMCYFGHTKTSARVNGHTVWHKNPWPSFWPDIPSGVRLCAKCYGAACRARRDGKASKKRLHSQAWQQEDEQSKGSQSESPAKKNCTNENAPT